MELEAKLDEFQDRCRICLEEFIDPPIKPCNCSSGLFHKECLKEFLTKTLIEKTKKIIS